MAIFELEFMRRAILASALVGLAAPSIGIFLVQRRLSLMGDGIGHFAFMGVAAGLFIGTSPVITGIAAACLAAVIIEALRGRTKTSSDVALSLIFYGGISGGALLAYLSGQSNQILGYLFGSVLTVNSSDLWILGLASVAVVATTQLLRKELFAVCYDEEVARVSGLPVSRLGLLIALAAAVTVGVTMRVVGLLLVSAMLVLPVATAQLMSRSFRSTVFAGMAIGTTLSVGGLVIAFYADTAPGATIVLAAIVSFAGAGLISRLKVAR